MPSSKKKNSPSTATPMPSHPVKTYELRITFTDARDSDIKASEVKQRTIALLKSLGVDSFVEGALDGLDIDNEFTNEPRDFYSELGGAELPISIFKYSKEFLDDIQAKIEQQFTHDDLGQVNCSQHEMETAVWLEGWKESFKPIVTDKFAIYPPWDKPGSDIANGRILLEIEPGIAFGTGQHATTQLCLRALEKIAEQPASYGLDKEPNQCRLLDVGTGTGILALGATKLGFSSVGGTDIDPDAVLAARNNAAINSINLDVVQSTIPNSEPSGDLPTSLRGPFDIVVANILKVVLESILQELANAVRPGGLLVMSGLLAEDAQPMAMAAEKLGFLSAHTTTQDDWACLVMKKRPLNAGPR